MANLEIYNFYEKYPKRDRNKLAFIGCFIFIENWKNDEIDRKTKKF